MATKIGYNSFINYLNDAALAGGITRDNTTEIEDIFANAKESVINKVRQGVTQTAGSVAGYALGGALGSYIGEEVGKLSAELATKIWNEIDFTNRDSGLENTDFYISIDGQKDMNIGVNGMIYIVSELPQIINSENKFDDAHALEFVETWRSDKGKRIRSNKKGWLRLEGFKNLDIIFYSSENGILGEPTKHLVEMIELGLDNITFGDYIRFMLGKYGLGESRNKAVKNYIADYYELKTEKMVYELDVDKEINKLNGSINVRGFNVSKMGIGALALGALLFTLNKK